MSESVASSMPEIPNHWKIPKDLQETGVRDNIQIAPEHGFLAQRYWVVYGNIEKIFRRECLFGPNGEIRALMVDRGEGLLNRENEITLYPDSPSSDFSSNYSLYSSAGLGPYGIGLEIKFSSIGRKGFRLSESGRLNMGEYAASVNYRSFGSDETLISQVEFSGDLQAGGEDVSLGPPAHLYFDKERNLTPQTEEAMTADGWKKAKDQNEYLFDKKREKFKFSYSLDPQSNRAVLEYADLQSGRRNKIEALLKVNMREVFDALDRRVPYQVKEVLRAKVLDIPWLGIRDVVGVSFSPPILSSKTK